MKPLNCEMSVDDGEHWFPVSPQDAIDKKHIADSMNQPYANEVVRFFLDLINGHTVTSLDGSLLLRVVR